MKKVLVIMGTRPEAIKLAPVLLELHRREEAEPILCVTGQHRQMLESVLDVFGFTPNIDLKMMRPGQHLTELLGRMLIGIRQVLSEVRPDAVLVQGDTTTVLAGCLASFLDHIPVGHVEAGLRTRNKFAPFPEEVNRRAAGVVATWHFAPTPSARDNLLAEQVDPATVFVTGNTVVDALRWMQSHLNADDLPPFADPALRLVLVTAHRRENLGTPLTAVCVALRQLTREFADIQVIYPVHLNPLVQETVRRTLEGSDRILLTDPVDYRHFVALMSRSSLILTDSGGIQEEATILGKPVLVLRETSERPEGIRAGRARLVGTDTDRILAEARKALSGTGFSRTGAIDLYGDGLAARRIVDIVLYGRSTLPEFSPIM